MQIFFLSVFLTGAGYFHLCLLTYGPNAHIQFILCNPFRGPGEKHALPCVLTERNVIAYFNFANVKLFNGAMVP